MTGVQTCALPICFPVTIPVLRIDCTNIDFVNDVNDQNLVLDTIEEKLVDLGLKPQSWLDKVKAKRIFHTVDFPK